MKKLIIIALALVFCLSANALEISDLNANFDLKEKNLQIKIIIQNPENADKALLGFEVLKNGQRKFIDFEIIQLKNGLNEISFNKMFVPVLNGYYELRLSVPNTNGIIENQKTTGFIVEEEKKYYALLNCLTENILPGQKESAKLEIINLGNSFNDIKLKYWIEDINNQRINEINEIPVAVQPIDSRNFLLELAIKPDALSGIYYFATELDFNTGKETEKCAFFVEKKTGLAKLENKMNEKIESPTGLAALVGLNNFSPLTGILLLVIAGLAFVLIKKIRKKQ